MSDKKITVLIGAGASSPFVIKGGIVLTTHYLTNSLLNPHLWEKILLDFRKYHSDAQSTSIWNCNKEDVLFVLERIKTFLSYKNTPNFEKLLYFLDRVALNLYCHYDWFEGILPDFWCDNCSDIKKKAYLKSNSDGWKYVPFLAREVLIRSILDLWNPDDVLIQGAIASNNLFYKTLNDQFKYLSVYSLNYDPLLYESIKDIHLIKNCFINTALGFENEDFFKAEKIVAFLHGHVGFLPLGAQMFFETSYEKAQIIRMKNAFCKDTNQTKFFDITSNGMHYNTYLISGLNKIDAFYSNPFACYTHRFSKDVLESDYIVVIGCSLDDDHLILFLKNTLAYSKKKILFVTKEKTEPDKDLFHQPFIDKFNKTWVKSGDKLILSLDSMDIELPKFFKQLNNNFIQNGFGHMVNNVFMYLKGAEEFYKITDIDDLFTLISETQKTL